MDNNDYEKAKEDYWRKWTYEAPTGMSLSELAEARRVFNFAFDRAYQLGKASVQDNGESCHIAGEERFIQTFDGQTENSPNRVMIAAMAMQGLLSNSTWMSNLAKGFSKEYDNDKDASAALMHEIVSSSVEITDALLTELRKENNG